MPLWSLIEKGREKVERELEKKAQEKMEWGIEQIEKGREKVGWGLEQIEKGREKMEWGLEQLEKGRGKMWGLGPLEKSRDKVGERGLGQPEGSRGKEEERGLEQPEESQGKVEERELEQPEKSWETAEEKGSEPLEKSPEMVEEGGSGPLEKSRETVEQKGREKGGWGFGLGKLERGIEKLEANSSRVTEYWEGLTSEIEYPALAKTEWQSDWPRLKETRMPILQFCERNYQGRVTNVYCCQEKWGVKHEFLLVEVDECPQAPMGKMWLRLERTFRKASLLDAEMIGEYTPSVDAQDLAGVASRHEDLNHWTYSIMEKLSFNHLSLKNLTRLLSLFVHMSGEYTVFKRNCWAFCLTVIDCLCPHSVNPDGVFLRRPHLNQEFRERIKASFQQAFSN